MQFVVFFLLGRCFAKTNKPYVILQVDTDRETSNKQFNAFQTKAYQKAPSHKECPYAVAQFSNQAGGMTYFKSFERKFDDDGDLYYTSYLSNDHHLQSTHIMYGRVDLQDPGSNESKYICISTNSVMIKRATGRHGCLMRSKKKFKNWPPLIAADETVPITFEYVVDVEWYSRLSRNGEPYQKCAKFSRTKVLTLKCMMRGSDTQEMIPALEQEMKIDLKNKKRGLPFVPPLEIHDKNDDLEDHWKETNNNNEDRIIIYSTDFPSQESSEFPSINPSIPPTTFPSEIPSISPTIDPSTNVPSLLPTSLMTLAPKKSFITNPPSSSPTAGSKSPSVSPISQMKSGSLKTPLWMSRETILGRWSLTVIVIGIFALALGSCFCIRRRAKKVESMVSDLASHTITLNPLINGPQKDIVVTLHPVQQNRLISVS